MADKKAEIKKTASKKVDSKKAAKNKKPNVFRRLLKYLSSCKGMAYACTDYKELRYRYRRSCCYGLVHFRP